MKNVFRMAFLFLVALVSSCGILPKAPPKVDMRMVYAWPVEQCPSAEVAGGARSAFLGGVGGVLIGNIVNGVIGIPVSAITAGAEADLQGLKASGTNARYYYQIENAGGKSALVLPECYIVAYAYPLRTPGKHWCDDPSFKASVPGACGTGKSYLSMLKVREAAGGVSGLDITSLSTPEMYMEIGFDKSSYSDAVVVRPKIIAMHYPKSIIQPKSDKERLISVQLEFVSPQQNDPLKGAQTAIVIPFIKPAPTIDRFYLDNVITGWTLVPNKVVGELPKPAGPSEKLPFMPVTIKAAFNEVGNPNVFLQAFAKSFSGSAAEYSKLITSEISPLAREAADQAQDKSAADYADALAAAQKSRADLLGLCATIPTTKQGKANALSVFTSTTAKQRKANLAAETAGKKKNDVPFSSPDVVEGVDANCWQ